MKARIVFAVLLGSILFIKLLYGNYTNMDHWAKGYDPCREYCEDDFAKLLKAARAKNMIDYDPICQCKHGGEKYVMFSGANGATVNDYRVTMIKLSDARASWVLVLRWVDHGWKIHDILEPRSGKQVSVRQRLAGAVI
jgi:hypothetical protein